jgi:glutamine synthetase
MTDTRDGSSLPASDASPEDVQARLAGDGVRLVACTFIDLAGVTRVKVIPVARLASAIRYGIGISYVSTVFAVDDAIAKSPGFDTPTGDMRLRPDPDAVVVLPDAPGWAWAPVNQDTQDLDPMPACPRRTLQNAEAAAAAQGLSFLMAAEVEFSLFDTDGQPVHRGPGYGARALLEAGDFPLDLVDVLSTMGLALEQFHPEYATGQYEISIAPDSPVRAADRLALLRATIVRVARCHGYQVSFAPAAMAGEVGNGCHLHFSAWSDGRNFASRETRAGVSAEPRPMNLMSNGDGPFGMTATAEALAAGVLQHLPDLSALLTPSVISYERLQPSHWAGPFTTWGPENREAALRFICGSAGTRSQSANFELKPIDGAANPYLSMAAVIVAGLDGLDRGLRLPDPVTVDPATLSEDDRASRGIHRLPADLQEAIERFASSTFVRAMLGDPLFEAFLAVRRLEWETFGTHDVADVIDAHRWRYG